MRNAWIQPKDEGAEELANVGVEKNVDGLEIEMWNSGKNGEEIQSLFWWTWQCLFFSGLKTKTCNK